MFDGSRAEFLDQVFSSADVVLAVDVGGVVVDGVRGGVEGSGDFFVGFALFEEALDGGAFFGGGVGEGVVEPFGELLAGVNVVLFVDGFHVDVDGGVAYAQVLGDFVVGEALEQAVEDLLAALAGWAEEVGAVFSFSFFGGVEVLGARHFVAVEQAGGDVGDEVVPGVAACYWGEVADVVAGVAGERCQG